MINLKSAWAIYTLSQETKQTKRKAFSKYKNASNASTPKGVIVLTNMQASFKI